MSLSKLDPNPTPGSSSQVSDDQDPFSEKQHPLHLPTVLDTIFPYLTFAEIKSNRLVCKPWGEVGIPFIGRRKLEPVNFSDVSHEDFIALKQEFQEFEDPSKPHPKLKLFQGFRLTWEDVITMAYCNFMPSFKPSQLYISGDVINYPSVSLMALLQPIVATLRDLTIKIKWPSSYPTSFHIIRNLAEILGLTLQRLHLQILNERQYLPSHFQGRMMVPFSGDVSIIRETLNTLLENQAPFLEELSLKIECYVEMNDDRVLVNKIQFPIFPHLQSLALIIEFKTVQGGSLHNFEPFDFCTKFPNLLQLDLLDPVLSEMSQRGTFDSTNGHPLKKLNIIKSSGAIILNFSTTLNKLGISFPLLEEFSAQDIIINGEMIPWMDTMKNLEICGPSHEFNLIHLKKLENLHYSLHSVALSVDVNVNELINRLLDHYAQLPHLKKLHLSGFEVSPEQMIQIQEELPAEIRTILTFD